MSGESDSDFVKSVEDLLEAGRTVEAKSVFSATEHAAKVKNNSWDLIPVLSKYLSTPLLDGGLSPEVFKCSKQLLNSIADLSNPEEALLQFIEEIEETDSDVKFIALLEPLRRILLRIPKKRLISLAWGFNALQSYLKKHPVPESENLQGKEKLLLDSFEETQNINELYKSVLNFYEHLKQNFQENVEDSEEKSSITLKFLIRLLGRPLVYLDVEIFDAIKGRARISSENLVSQLFQIRRDPVSLLEYRFNDSDNIFKFCDLGLASLFYLVYSEGIHLNHVPKVYDPLYFFQSSLYLVTILLKLNHQIVVEKGLKLAMSLLQHIKYLKLSHFLLDSEDHEEFCKALSKIIVYNEIDTLRKLGVEIYKTYLSCFETRGFYLLIYNLISELTHPGLKGYTITLYKDLVVREFHSKKDLSDLSPYVRGKKLLTLLKKFCFLHKKEESDLIELSDEIIATLNLLRYLAIRDSQNMSQIWDFFPILDELYFKYLRKGIDLSRAHYKLKIKEVQEETADKDIHTDVNILIRGESLSKLSKEEKIEILNSSLTVFDILDSLLSRLQECIEAGKIK